MREEKLFRAIGDVGDDLIARADEPVQKKKPVRWTGIAALAACCVLAIGMARLVTLSMGKTADTTASADCAAPENMMVTAESAESTAAPQEKSHDETASADMAETETADEADAPAGMQANAAERWTIGPLTLGMSGDEIQEILGAPDDESNSGPVEYEDGSRRVCWFYQIDNAPGQLYSVKLDLADFGGGWVLDAITVWPDAGWKTAEGIGIGSTEEEVRAAYPDAEISDDTVVEDDVEVPRTFFTIGEGQTKLRIMVRDGTVEYLDLGTFFAEPPMGDE